MLPVTLAAMTRNSSNENHDAANLDEKLSAFPLLLLLYQQRTNYDVGNPRKRTTSAAQQPGGRDRTSFGAGAGPSAGSAARKRAVTVSAGMALKCTRQSPNGGTCKNNALPAQSSVTVTAAALQR